MNSGDEESRDTVLALRDSSWPSEHNFNHTNQSPGYLTPLEYIDKELAKISSCCYPCDQVAHNIDKIIRVCYHIK
jgi:hypothetical protein